MEKLNIYQKLLKISEAIGVVPKKSYYFHWQWQI